jgi:hypothetical protein
MTGGKLMKNTLKILVVSAIFGAILTGCGTSAEGNNDAANAAAPATSMEKKSMGKADDATAAPTKMDSKAPAAGNTPAPDKK